MASKKKKPRPSRAGKGKPASDERYELFIAEYVKNGRNASAAARDAGYSEDAAAQIGNRLLRKDHIRKKISDLTAEHLSKVKLEGEQAMLRIQQIGVFDPRRIFDKDGCVLPPDEWPDDIACAIAGFEVKETFHPLTGRHTGYVKKVKFKDGLRAMEDMAQHLGQLKPDGAVNVNVPITVVNEDEVKKAREEIKNDC
jgi:phage terminase small subunit